MPNYGPVTECQISGSNQLTSVIFLGFIPPVNLMQSIGSPAQEEPSFPAEVLYCPESHLVQLGYAVDPNVLFPPEYPYTSGTTRILRENFADLYRGVTSRMELSESDLVVDIGSNDGTLLSNFSGKHRVFGIEPSLQAKRAVDAGVPSLMEFFGRNAVDQTLSKHGQAKVITATNVFAHIANVHDVVDQIERLLTPDGVFVSESHYLLDLIKTLQYDTIYHEHLRYYSLISLKYLLERHGFRIFDVTRIPTHGGSIRVYASKSDQYPVSDSVAALMKEEEEAGLNSEAFIPEFRRRVLESKLALYEMLAKLKRDGKRIFGVGAPSRASTLINYTGLDDGVLECIMEIKGSQKIGKYIPGRRIPVLEESKLYDEQPSHALLLSWHIAEELCPNLKKRGYRGDFIVPLPEPRIIHNEDV